MGSYYVLASDGQKYGPADFNTLKQWAAEGRLNEHTTLEDAATGARVVASSVPGLFEGAAQTMPPSGPAAGPMAGPGAPQAGPYQAQQPGNYANYPRGGAPTKGYNDALIVFAWVLPIVGLCCCPLVIGGAGIGCAVAAKNQGNPKADAALIGSIVLTVAGVIIGALVGLSNPTMMRQLLGK